MKHPVPKVAFMSPGFIQFCPTAADCWSPIIAKIGILEPTMDESVIPNLEILSLTSGSMELGILNISKSSSSHWLVLILNKLVLDAFVTSV